MSNLPMSNAFVRQRFGNVASMDIPTYTGAKILDLGAEQPTAAELFWYPNLFWYTPTGNWLVEASNASILPLMWWGLLPALP
jgi:hypothetical protein